MDEQRWRRVKEIFQRAVERPEDERQRFVERQCGSDAELLAEVLSLLATDSDGTEFLEVSPEPVARTDRPAAREPAFDDERYRLLRKVGEGGMGEVYEAEQMEPVRRRVALKVIKRGMDTREVIARFETERQALALMNHPSIARVFDAGSTAQGRPFFAMEFVEGVPITDYCDSRRLGTRERLALFRDVCAAVQHAHQKGVIHRDLKPSNILVALDGDEALPKVIDFGVSKAIDQRLTESTLFTQLGHWVGTPEYMSPEQADLGGLDVDTRTDVYALGVVLYELLVGAKPFDSESLRKAGFDEIRRIIREEDPPKPSTRVSSLGDASGVAARNRRVDSVSLRRALRGDLDAIAMRALEKDRTLRYGSPSELSDDLGRYLDNQPILASPPSAAYRARKFVRRHRLGVAAAAVTLLAIVAGGVLALWQARIATRERDRAERRFQDVRQLANTMIFDVYNAIEDLAGSTPARELVVKEALVYLDALAAEAENDDELRFELASAYAQIGDVQGYIYRPNLGDIRGADRSYERVFELLGELTVRAEPDPAHLARLGWVHVRRGVIRSELDDVDAAEAEFRSALVIGQRLVDQYPLPHDGQRIVIHANEALGIALEEVAEFDAALELYRSNLEIELGVLEGDPAGVEARHDVMGSRGRIGQALQGLHRWSEAAEQHLLGVEILDELVVEDPDNAFHRRTRAFLHREVARSYAHLGRFDEAEPLFERAWQTLRELHDLDPEDVLLAGDLGVVAAQRGRALALQGRPREALPWLDQAVAYGDSVPIDYHESYDVAIYLIRIHLHRGETLLQLGALGEATQAFGRAIATGEPIIVGDPRRAKGWADLSVAQLRYAAALASPSRAEAECVAARLNLERGVSGLTYLRERGVPVLWPSDTQLNTLRATVATACP